MEGVDRMAMGRLHVRMCGQVGGWVDGWAGRPRRSRAVSSQLVEHCASLGGGRKGATYVLVTVNRVVPGNGPRDWTVHVL